MILVGSANIRLIKLRQTALKIAFPCKSSALDIASVTFICWTCMMTKYPNSPQLPKLLYQAFRADLLYIKQSKIIWSAVSFTKLQYKFQTSVLRMGECFQVECLFLQSKGCNFKFYRLLFIISHF